MWSLPMEAPDDAIAVNLAAAISPHDAASATSMMADGFASVSLRTAIGRFPDGAQGLACFVSLTEFWLKPTSAPGT
jgi:hypothetical protein